MADERFGRKSFFTYTAWRFWRHLRSNSMRKTGLILFVLMFATVAHAEVYKCTDAAGNLVFSDKPCAVDAEIAEGVEKVMTIWFANYNKPHIRSIRFQAVVPD